MNLRRRLRTIIERFPDSVEPVHATRSMRQADRRPARILGEVPDEWAKNMRGTKVDSDIYLVVRINRSAWDSIDRVGKAQDPEREPPETLEDFLRLTMGGALTCTDYRIRSVHVTKDDRIEIDIAPTDPDGVPIPGKVRGFRVSGNEVSPTR